MKNIDIKERQKKILYAIVEMYVDTALPVGSRTLSQRFRWSMSPATIRNVMADLEEQGLITHPHTSAGRVPTDKGYRLYVDSILEPRLLTKDEEALIYKMLHRRYEDFQHLMQNVSRSISMITNMAGVAIAPRLKRSIFKHVEFIPLDSDRMLVVLMTRSGIIKNIIIDKEDDITKTELFRISEFLNEELEGMFLGDIKNFLTRRLLEHRDSFYTFLKKAVNILSKSEFLRMEDRLCFNGATSLMLLPEFSDINKIRTFLKLFEEQEDLLELFNQDMERDGIKVHIGKENPCKNIQDCAVVTCNYKIGDKIVGSIGAIGPTRMEYGKVISAVNHLSKALEKALEEFV